ncbi:fluoride efflux transporter CrcB [Pseudogracilibacillus sp. SO30301A]|uniref:fluoride efflux transporter CrcB n=1 Tax=Pseudogracilibacillus sp. SO30301A TaxID=3098291 RepID=UPI00300E4F7B
MIIQILLVATGGFFGSMLRFYISNKCHKHFIGTLIANVSGSILLGILLKYHLENAIPKSVWLILGIGFCGAYTTFSTFGNETIQLMEAKQFRSALLYVISTFFVSIGIVWSILI